jgi:hypothetical protein
MRQYFPKKHKEKKRRRKERKGKKRRRRRRRRRRRNSSLPLFSPFSCYCCLLSSPANRKAEALKTLRPHNTQHPQRLTETTTTSLYLQSL